MLFNKKKENLVSTTPAPISPEQEAARLKVLESQLDFLRDPKRPENQTEDGPKPPQRPSLRSLPPHMRDAQLKAMREQAAAKAAEEGGSASDGAESSVGAPAVHQQTVQLQTQPQMVQLQAQAQTAPQPQAAPQAQAAPQPQTAPVQQSQPLQPQPLQLQPDNAPVQTQAQAQGQTQIQLQPQAQVLPVQGGQQRPGVLPVQGGQTLPGMLPLGGPQAQASSQAPSQPSLLAQEPSKAPAVHNNVAPAVQPPESLVHPGSGLLGPGPQDEKKEAAPVQQGVKPQPIVQAAPEKAPDPQSLSRSRQMAYKTAVVKGPGEAAEAPMPAIPGQPEAEIPAAADAPQEAAAAGEQAKEAPAEEGREAAAEEKEEKPAEIKNPLPTPKKHVPKEMDFDLVPETKDMHFDVVDMNNIDFYDLE
ncbi:MAG: hypothetical protein IKI75_09035 [Lachnospiraceae bacterium]|nr:hypothetical protein [Lachnospiraceae bacterium]